MVRKNGILMEFFIGLMDPMKNGTLMEIFIGLMDLL
jgi:hypothetical protein